MAEKFTTGDVALDNKVWIGLVPGSAPIQPHIFHSDHPGEAAAPSVPDYDRAYAMWPDKPQPTNTRPLDMLDDMDPDYVEINPLDRRDSFSYSQLLPYSPESSRLRPERSPGFLKKFGGAVLDTINNTRDRIGMKYEGFFISSLDEQAVDHAAKLREAARKRIDRSVAEQIHANQKATLQTSYDHEVARNIELHERIDGRNSWNIKDKVANLRDRVRIGLGKLAVTRLELDLIDQDEVIAKATASRRKVESKEERAASMLHATWNKRAERIGKHADARERIEKRNARKTTGRRTTGSSSPLLFKTD